MKKKVLVIVAHPDDEVIWMGGTLLSNINNWNLTILSLCRKNDKDRAPKFRKICKILKAKCFISDLEDEKLDDMPINGIIKRIKNYSDKSYDYIFTHGEKGEYGHKRHIDVNKAVVEMLDKKILSCKKVFFFSYKKKDGICYADKTSDKFIRFDNNHFQDKKKLIRQVYGFRKDDFEDICCQETEAFNIQEVI